MDAGKLHDIFDRYGLANTFEVYHGTYTSAVRTAFQNHSAAVLRQEPVCDEGLQMTRGRRGRPLPGGTAASSPGRSLT